MSYDMVTRSAYKIIFVLLFSIIAIEEIKSQDTPDSKFKSGIELYSSGKYNEALGIWVELYNSGIRSSELDYNIASAYYKLNNIPGSLLFYERALLLDPADEDSRYNLQIARRLVVDKFVEIPELFFVSWFNFVSLVLSTNVWAITSIVCFIVFLVLGSIYIYSSRYRLKVIGFWLAILMLLMSIAALSFSLRNRSLVINNQDAIIFSPVVNGKSSPDNSGTDLFVLHEGTKVTVEDEVGNWYEIRLSDGNKGWVPSDCLEKL
jgi:tetratricopeptide (TPR) repeat protein